MPLPILHAAHRYSPPELLRLFHQTEARWSQHLAEEEQLDIGTAYSNARLSGVRAANHLRDVALPPDMTPAQAWDQVECHYQRRGVYCAGWTLNSSAPEAGARSLVEYLLSRDHRAVSGEVLLLAHVAQRPNSTAPGLKIIPARASFRHMRLLAEEAAGAVNTPRLADAAMLHLDDPHWDALLAIEDQTPVACIGVLTVGEVGRIDHLFVAPTHRRRGIARIMLARALEICARSLFKHVMLSVASDNTPALALVRQFGFHSVGQITSYIPAGR
jgi:ribosomal protein S18 acetylase RimI-like enzyme